MYLWRISKHVDLSGRGGLLASGRWNFAGLPVVYCCDHPSTTLLEVIVHTDPEDIPSEYTLLKINCPDNLPTMRLDDRDVDLSDLDATQEFGSALLLEKKACLIDVQCVIMPEARNVLINPLHARAGEIIIEDVKTYPFDSRLLRS
ncbi:RES family NAD+ phosphorylase [Rhizobium sp. S152]|uniref:RES family NAD+ phosphorylase n=1 Tax=Rhizobium sp. S152 TaxID=3055038 RepID=UPI0025A9DEB1|nr:RES family NAD+ phosphorylase [Rhizobium sp. S152]MDM9626530.1 RES family NAD+ phosphorylase [Rhizobium sp. S152]